MSERDDLRGPTIIEPVDLGGAVVAGGERRSIRRWIALSALLLVVVGLFVAGWFVLSARQVELTFAPEADRVELTGPVLRFQIGERYLLRSGEYQVDALRAGYHPLQEKIVVAGNTSNAFHFEFRKLPGLITVRCVGADDPSAPLEGVLVRIDDRRIPAPIDDLEVEPGVHRVELEHERYQRQVLEITVEGAGTRQAWNWEMRPDWARAAVASLPAGASVTVDGAPAGSTPCAIDLRSGPRVIELTADGFRPWTRELAVVAEEPVDLTGIVLERLPGYVLVRTDPPGAQVMIDDDYAGVTPITSEAPPDREVRVRVTRDGYEPAERVVRVVSQETTEVTLELTALLGTVRLEVDPPDAVLHVDDERWGLVPSDITLSAVEHELTFSKPGFEPATRTVRPRPDIAGRLVVTLEPVTPDLSSIVREAKAANGYELVLLLPGDFQMGASRGEQGSRSNETLRKVSLTRALLMGVREVTNAEYRTFDRDHQSGTIGTLALGGETRPVVQVTWDDAARFCNWMSAQEGLPPAYVERADGRMVATSPMTTGYRLPTEAEWEYAARTDGSKPLLKYPWGMTFPPREKSGNFADESAASILNRRIADYDDAHAASAPVGTFSANVHGLFDMGGNVAEWCHDFYGVYTYDAASISVDPEGPEDGQHHVIRGSSWRSSSISTLRLSYRNYGQDKRDDLGFRVCRHLPAINTEPDE